MNEENRILSSADADRLLAAKDGAAALLYLHILRRGGFSLTDAAADLRLSEAETARAAETLRRLGLLHREQPLPEKAMPEYTAEDIGTRARTDPGFEDVVAEAQRALGRVLSTADLKLLFGIYDYLALPPDVIMLLLHHCIEDYQRRSGAGRMPSMRAVEKEAWFWAENEITTLDAAEEHIRRDRERQQLGEQVKEVLQIRGRALTASEAKYVQSWLDLGFLPDAIAVAYDRTVLSTGRLVWKYMDRILQSWSEKKLFTPAEIEAGDARRVSPARPAADTPPEDEQKRRNQEILRKMYEQMNGGTGHGD